MLGFVMGNFMNDWLGIPANYQLASLRFGFNVTVRNRTDDARTSSVV